MKNTKPLFSTPTGGALPRARARYLTQAIALEERPPSGIISASVFLSLFLITAAIVWASLTVVHETARAPGEVVPAEHSINVQHLEGGLVKSLFVREGDRVRKGDPLLLLDDTALQSELQQMRVREASLNLQAERLAALLEQREPDFGIAGAQYLYLAGKQQTIYQAQRRSFEREREVIDSQIRQREQELIRQRNLVASRQDEVALLEQQVKLQSQMLQENLVAKSDLLITQTRLAEARGNLAQARDSALVAAAALEEAKQRKLELEAGFFKDIELESGKVAAELAEISQALIRVRDRVERLDIRAPSDGIVQNLSITSGQVVIEPGQMILQIIPEDDELVVEAKVSPADIGHVQPGHRADIRVDSYDIARFGLLQGTVERISATTYLDAQHQPYYRAEISLKSDHLGSDAHPLRIIPGMTVVADIRTGEKTLMDYLLRPIRRGMNTAFGER